MAQKYFKGGAASVAQVDTFTPGGTITTGDVNTLTYTAPDGTTTATNFTTTGTTTAAAVSAGLIAAWNGNATLAAVASATGTSTVILTSVSAGVPFGVVSSVMGVGTLTRAATTPNSGAMDWGTPSNWSDGATPVNGDTVILDGRMANAIIYGLNQSAVTLAELDDYSSRRLAIGTATVPLKIGATIAGIGAKPNDGSTGQGAFINIDFGTVVGEFTVFSSAASGAGGLAPVTLTGNNASNILNVVGGIVWLGRLTPNQTGTFATVNTTAGTLTIGTGTTVTALNGQGGTVIVEKVNSSMNVISESGKIILNGAAKVGTITADPGSNIVVNNRTSGADVGTLNMNGGTVDFQQKPTAFTCDTLNIHRGGILKLFTASQATWTATTWDSTDETKLEIKLAA